MDDLTSLRAMAGRKRWNRDDARLLVEAWQARGGSLSAFARSVGCEYERLRRWTKVLGCVEPAGTTAPRFIEVRAKTSSRPFEVVVEGAVIRVPPDFDPAALRRLLTLFGPC